MAQALRIFHIVLSLGLCLVIERYKLNPKLRFAVWGLVALNELGGLARVYYFGASAFQFVS